MKFILISFSLFSYFLFIHTQGFLPEHRKESKFRFIDANSTLEMNLQKYMKLSNPGNSLISPDNEMSFKAKQSETTEFTKQIKSLEEKTKTFEIKYADKEASLDVKILNLKKSNEEMNSRLLSKINELEKLIRKNSDSEEQSLKEKSENLSKIDEKPKIAILSNVLADDQIKISEKIKGLSQKLNSISVLNQEKYHNLNDKFDTASKSITSLLEKVEGIVKKKEEDENLKSSNEKSNTEIKAKLEKSKLSFDSTNYQKKYSIIPLKPQITFVRQSESTPIINSAFSPSILSRPHSHFSYLGFEDDQLGSNIDSSNFSEEKTITPEELTHEAIENSKSETEVNSNSNQN